MFSAGKMVLWVGVWLAECVSLQRESEKTNLLDPQSSGCWRLPASVAKMMQKNMKIKITNERCSKEFHIPSKSYRIWVINIKQTLAHTQMKNHLRTERTKTDILFIHSNMCLLCLCTRFIVHASIMNRFSTGWIIYAKYFRPFFVSNLNSSFRVNGPWSTYAYEYLLCYFRSAFGRFGGSTCIEVSIDSNRQTLH